LHLFKTEKRNAVIIYLAVESRKFAIYGDDGINNVVPIGFWNNVANEMKSQLSKGNNSLAIINAVSLCGENLKKHFPIQSDDSNELSNNISFGK
jgi:uncharacterized membrane protein